MKKLLGIVLGPALGIACRMVDDVIPAEEMRSFLQGHLSGPPTVWADQPSIQDWRLSRGLAVRAGLLRPDDVDPDSLSAPETGRGREDFPDVEQCRDWIEAVPDGKVVTRKRLIQGTGVWLDRIAEQGDDAFVPFLDKSFSALLRSVEISRQKSCRLLEPHGDATAVATERANVAIAFSRRARRENDLRYLNAALKLGDWALPFHRRRAPDPVLARYLVSLAEQELTVKVLLS